MVVVVVAPAPPPRQAPRRRGRKRHLRRDHPLPFPSRESMVRVTGPSLTSETCFRRFRIFEPLSSSPFCSTRETSEKTAFLSPPSLSLFSVAPHLHHRPEHAVLDAPGLPEALAHAVQQRPVGLRGLRGRRRGLEIGPGALLERAQQRELRDAEDLPVREVRDGRAPAGGGGALLPSPLGRRRGGSGGGGEQPGREEFPRDPVHVRRPVAVGDADEDEDSPADGGDDGAVDLAMRERERDNERRERERERCEGEMSGGQRRRARERQRASGGNKAASGRASPSRKRNSFMSLCLFFSYLDARRGDALNDCSHLRNQIRTD